VQLRRPGATSAPSRAVNFHAPGRMWPLSRRVNTTGIGDDDPTLVDKIPA
jgi:hypothetical protein